MSVLAVIITTSAPMPQCIDAIEGEGVPYIVNKREPEVLSDNPVFNLYLNCSRNRNEARERALKSDASHFLILDDDIVIPRGTVCRLLSHRVPVVTGYYPIMSCDPTKPRQKDGRYVAGRWVADHVFLNYAQVFPGLVRTDSVGMGCAMIRRDVLERIPFESGTDQWCKSANMNNELIILGECGMYGSRCLDNNIQPLVDGNVVCKHLDRNFTSIVSV